MLESIGATDRHVRLVISANGAVVGIAGATLGFVLGIVLWFAYRPSLEQSSHHLIGVLALSWPVVIAAMLLAVVAALFAASRPARAITRVPIVQALSGRPAAPRQIHRSAVPGIVLLVLAFLLLGYSGWGPGQLAEEMSRGAWLHTEAVPDLVFDTVIPRNVRVGEAPSYGLPVTHHDPLSAGAEAYFELAKEVAARG